MTPAMSVCLSVCETEAATDTQATERLSYTITKHTCGMYINKREVISLARELARPCHQACRHARTDWNLASTVSTTHTHTQHASLSHTATHGSHWTSTYGRFVTSELKIWTSVQKNLVEVVQHKKMQVHVRN